jgi:hypothetical protein
MSESELSRLHREVAFGRAGGKIIWQPRIGCWYTDKLFAHERFPEPFTDMSLPDIYRNLRCSARIYEYNSCFQAIEDPRVEVKTNKVDELTTEHVIKTPVGTQRQVYRQSPNNSGQIVLKWPISDEDEMRVHTWRLQRTEWKWNHLIGL